MALTPEQIGRLLQMIRQTPDIELTCPQCLDELDKYAQGTLDGVPINGVPINDVMQRVREHLAACSCCHDQYTLVMETLAALEDL